MPRQWLSEMNLFQKDDATDNDTKCTSNEFGEIRHDEGNRSGDELGYSDSNDLGEGASKELHVESKRDGDGIKVPAQPIAGYIDFFDDNEFSESESAGSLSLSVEVEDVDPFEIMGMVSPQIHALDHCSDDENESESDGYRLDDSVDFDDQRWSEQEESRQFDGDDESDLNAERGTISKHFCENL